MLRCEECCSDGCRDPGRRVSGLQGNTQVGPAEHRTLPLAMTRPQSCAPGCLGPFSIPWLWGGVFAVFSSLPLSDKWHWMYCLLSNHGLCRFCGEVSLCVFSPFVSFSCAALCEFSPIFWLVSSCLLYDVQIPSPIFLFLFVLLCLVLIFLWWAWGWRWCPFWLLLPFANRVGSPNMPLELGPSGF